MRGLNISRELQALRPDASILFHVRTAPPPLLWDARFRYCVEGESAHCPDWSRTLASFAPDVAIYDTTLPKAGEEASDGKAAKRVYVMRKWQEDRQREIYAHPLLRRMDAVIVPHTVEEFGGDVPGWLSGRTHFVGPIVRLPDPAVQARLRARYGVGPGDFVLTSTCGGGGFEAQAGRFFRTVFEVHAALVPWMRHLRHILVRGPNYGRPLPPLDGARIVDAEPHMIDLLALSDLVIAEGGYNTVNEIRVTRAPAVFLPSARGKDAQEERVRELEARGLAAVFTESEHARVASAVAALCRDPAALDAMRARYAAERMDIGNRRAAGHIDGLLA